MSELTVILESRDYSEAALAAYRALGAVERVELADLLGSEALRTQATILVGRLAPIDGATLRALPRLRIIAIPATGLDHVDTTTAAALGVRVVSLRGEREFLDSIRATGEHTLALLLALLRRLPAAHRSVVDEGRWERERFIGSELCARTVGVVGAGRVGAQVARACLALGARVMATDPTPDASLAAAGVAFVPSLDELCARVDVLSVHVPLNAETTGLIGKRQLGALPTGALLVNTARGAVVDEAALAEALEQGRLAGAALDVMTDENGDGRHLSGGSVSGSGSAAGARLVELARRGANVILTPHIAGATYESMRKTEEHVARRVRALVEGGRTEGAAQRQ